MKDNFFQSDTILHFLRKFELEQMIFALSDMEVAVSKLCCSFYEVKTTTSKNCKDAIFRPGERAQAKNAIFC